MAKVGSWLVKVGGWGWVAKLGLLHSVGWVLVGMWMVWWRL